VSDSDFEPRERLHPLSWLFGAIGFIRNFLVPILVAAFFGSRRNMPMWIAVGILVPLIAGVWRQLFYRYGFGPDGLVIREGLFFRNVRQIDYSRIENIDTERGVLHRLLGVAEVKVESSTGGRAEALIQVVTLEAADELRRYVFARRNDSAGDAVGDHASATAEQELPLLQLPLGEIVKFGLIDNRGMVIVAALLGAAYEIGMIETWVALLQERTGFEYVESLVAAGLALQLLLALVSMIVVFVVMRLFSVAVAVLTLFDFRLTRAGEDLRARYGLLTRVTLTLRLARIQAVHRTETILHRSFNRVSVRVDLAGDSAPSDRSNEGDKRVRWLAPIVAPERADELIKLALPRVRLDESPDWQPLAAGARKRLFRRTAAIWTAIALGIGLAFRSPTAVLVFIAGIPLSWLSATMYVRHTRWALLSDVLLFRSGWLTRNWVVVPRDRIQVALCSENPFDRRHGMRSVAIDTAGSGARSDTVRIPYLERNVAERLAHALYLSAAQERSATVEEATA
jgi:putative membrane protein